MKEVWGLIDTDDSDAATNMAIDETLVKLHKAGKIPPTLRFYAWSTPSLSIGKNQAAEKAVNFDAVDTYGCQVVRRITGGSAVLHDDEMTYSLVISEDHPGVPTIVEDAYYEIAKALIKGYENLGIKANLSPKIKLSKKSSAVCFEQAAIYELNVAGKKISGNAQARVEGILLQHGSIPMSFDKDMLFDLIKFPDQAKKLKHKNAFSEKAISIGEILDYKPSYEELKSAFILGFKVAFDVEFEEISLTDQDLLYVEKLKDEKYAHLNWQTKKRGQHYVKAIK